MKTILVEVPAEIVFESTHLGQFTLDLNQCADPSKTATRILMYGRRMFNDSINSTEPEKRAARADAMLTAFKTGEFAVREGGGGRRLSLAERLFRNDMEAAIVARLPKVKLAALREAISATDPVPGIVDLAKKAGKVWSAAKVGLLVEATRTAAAEKAKVADATETETDDLI